jgi:hypothetical protein
MHRHESAPQIPFDFAQGRPSLRKRGLFGMTSKLHHYPTQRKFDWQFYRP